MFDRLLSTLKLAPPKSKGLIKELESVAVFVIAATESKGIETGSMNENQLLAEIQKAKAIDRKAQKESQKFFTYKDRTGLVRLPFFTSSENAQQFCAAYSQETGKVYPFAVLQTRGKFVGKIDPDSCHVVVMNDKTPGERMLTAAELGLAKRLWG